MPEGYVAVCLGASPLACGICDDWATCVHGSCRWRSDSSRGQAAAEREGRAHLKKAHDGQGAFHVVKATTLREAVFQ